MKDADFYQKVSDLAYQISQLRSERLRYHLVLDKREMINSFHIEISSSTVRGGTIEHSPFYVHPDFFTSVRFYDVLSSILAFYDMRLMELEDEFNALVNQIGVSEV